MGKQDIVFAGGGEEVHWTMTSMFDAMGALSTNYNATPEIASRAYDANRDGFVISGGGSILVLEEYEHAKARGGSSILPLIEAYNEEHLMRKAHCLHGEDVYGHLLGLESIAREQKQDIPAFFTDPGYLILTQNYISTISLGCHGILSYIAFTAGRAENIAINYTYNRNNINLVLTHPRNRTREMQKFATAVQAGIKQLLRILALSEPQDEV